MEKENEIPLHLLGYPDWQKEPFRLNRYEIAYPHKVIERYHSIYSLPDFRDYFKELVWDAHNSDSPGGKDYLGFQEETEKVIEAMYLIHEGELISDDLKKQQDEKAFITRLLREIDERAFDMSITSDKLETYQNPPTDVSLPEKEQLLQEIKSSIWQIRSALDSLILMVEHHGNDQYDLSLVPATLQTAPYINSCVRPFDNFKTAFNKGFSLQIDPLLPSTIICDKLKLKDTIQCLLHTAFIVCPEGSDVHLACLLTRDKLAINVHVKGPVSTTVNQEFFAAYQVFANSAIAGAHLYQSKVLATALGGTLTYHFDELKMYFKALIPFSVKAQ